MSRKAPGKSLRKGVSLRELFRKLPDDATSEAWFIERRWPSGIACLRCASANVQSGAKHETTPYRCREKQCAKRFSAKTGTVMESSKLGFQVWMIATCPLSTSLKSVSGMKLHPRPERQSAHALVPGAPPPGGTAGGKRVTLGSGRGRRDVHG